ncbi:MAG: ABC transporter permease [Pseudochelatococcus sp.]|jgi:peptide/nickel transport system permease protein|uniref:ABC transporter permease n=1 Tax=Pseudochelatococcus sp. TaxID=2020869 RepID=UPI003D9049E0
MSALELTNAGEKRSRSGLRQLLRSLSRSRTGLIGAILVSLFVATATFGAWIAPHSPTQRNLSQKFTPPAWVEGGTTKFLLGTDQQGRDIVSRIVSGSRASLIVGVTAVALSAFIGLILGLIAGYVGGIVDTAIMRVVDAMLAIPTMLFMLVIVLVSGSGLVPLIIVIAVTNWVAYTKLVRGEVLSIRERDYIKAARIAGAGVPRLLFRHITPNLLSAFVVVATLNVGSVILSEASLSFLGLGIQSPDVSWGQMLSDGRQYIATSWWVATFPGIALSLTVLGIMYLGDWLRDYLDPRLT